MVLLPPTERTFQSLSDVLQNVNNHAKSEDYAVVKQRTKTHKGVLNTVYLSCDRNSKYQAQNENFLRKPHFTSTQLTECSFSLVTKLKEGI